jgi:uncharacterized protein (DUF1697 family)
MSVTYLALLRGVNVGGKNILPMKDLSALFVEAGCEGVRTFIQSGNVLFRAAPRLVKKLPALIAEQIATRFGYRTPVLVRTAAQLEEVISMNPFVEQGAAEDALYVMFLADVPSPLCVDQLDPERSPPDTFVVSGREVYLHLPQGSARSKLTNNYFDAKLKTTSTARNWRTVNKLLKMMKE